MESAQKPVSIHFRMTKADYRKVMALKLKTEKSIQHLLELGLNTLMAQRGMEPIEGVPRPKKTGATMEAWRHVAKSDNCT